MRQSSAEWFFITYSGVDSPLTLSLTQWVHSAPVGFLWGRLIVWLVLTLVAGCKCRIRFFSFGDVMTASVLHILPLRASGIVLCKPFLDSLAFRFSMSWFVTFVAMEDAESLHSWNSFRTVRSWNVGNLMAHLFVEWESWLPDEHAGDQLLNCSLIFTCELRVLPGVVNNTVRWLVNVGLLGYAVST